MYNKITRPRTSGNILTSILSGRISPELASRTWTGGCWSSSGAWPPSTGWCASRWLAGRRPSRARWARRWTTSTGRSRSPSSSSLRQSWGRSPPAWSSRSWGWSGGSRTRAATGRTSGAPPASPSSSSASTATRWSSVNWWSFPRTTCLLSSWVMQPACQLRQIFKLSIFPVKYVLGSLHNSLVPAAILLTKKEIWQMAKQVMEQQRLRWSWSVYIPLFQVYQTGGTTQGRKFKMTAEQIQKELGLKIP